MEKNRYDDRVRGFIDIDLNKTLRTLASSALTDVDPLTRKHAIYLIGISRVDGCIPTLVQALRDPEIAVRGQAMQALASMGDPAFRVLVELLQDPDWKIRYRAAEALGLRRDKKAGSYLIGLLSDDKDHVRYMAAKSLGILGDPVAKEPLRKSLCDENQYVRTMASSALSKIENLR